METKRCISSLTLEQLTAELKAMGQPGFRAKQIFHWVHQKLVTDFSAMTDQPKALLAKLEEAFYIAAPIIERRQEAKDGTVKYLLRMADGNCIETVVMRYHYGNTVCVSTQVGCRMGCRFCASTQAGRVRNFEQLQKYIPELQKFNFPIDTYQFDPPMDSSDMEPDMWRKLVRIIHENYDRYHGFVILHGTDTMAYTASALSFMLEGLDKPVILTGSQLPIGVLRTDGKENLMTSIEIAVAQNKEGRALVPEVCIFFENHLMRGNRTTKMNAENFNAFRSFNYPVLAEAGIHIKYNNVQIHVNGEERELKPHYLLDTNVVVLKLFPGIQENVIAAILGIDGLKAVVLETYGSGNAPRKEWFIRRLCQASERGIVIVNVTQCSAGMVEMERYETGYQLLQAGVVSGYDSTTESAVTKLMFLLGHGYTADEVRDRMNRSMAGEITL